MASFLENLVGQVSTSYNEKGEAALDALLKRALEALPNKEELDPLSLGARMGAEEALKTLQQNISQIHFLGGMGLAAVLAKLAIGKTDEAADIWVKASGGDAGSEVDRTVAKLLLTDAQSIQENNEYKEKKRKAVEILRTIGSLTARYALPALLAALQASLAK